MQQPAMAARTTVIDRPRFGSGPPVHRAEEMSEDAMASSYSRVYQAKDYLVHA